MKKKLAILLAATALCVSALALAACNGDSDKGYVITLEAGAGTLTGGSTVRTNADGKLDILPAAPTPPAALAFDGWYTAATDGTKVDTTYVFKGNSTIYAQYADPVVKYMMADEQAWKKAFADFNDLNSVTINEHVIEKGVESFGEYKYVHGVKTAMTDNRGRWVDENYRPVDGEWFVDNDTYVAVEDEKVYRYVYDDHKEKWTKYVDTGAARMLWCDGLMSEVIFDAEDHFADYSYDAGTHYYTRTVAPAYGADIGGSSYTFFGYDLTIGFEYGKLAYAKAVITTEDRTSATDDKPGVNKKTAIIEETFSAHNSTDFALPQGAEEVKSPYGDGSGQQAVYTVDGKAGWEKAFDDFNRLNSVTISEHTFEKDIEVFADYKFVNGVKAAYINNRAREVDKDGLPVDDEWFTDEDIYVTNEDDKLYRYAYDEDKEAWTKYEDPTIKHMLWCNDVVELVFDAVAEYSDDYSYDESTHYYTCTIAPAYEPESEDNYMFIGYVVTMGFEDGNIVYAKAICTMDFRTSATDDKPGDNVRTTIVELTFTDHNNTEFDIPEGAVEVPNPYGN